MEKDIVKDIIRWDIENWSKALDLWKPELANPIQLNCLEIGGREGGLSLLAALYNHKVVCSDMENPQEVAGELHRKYEVKELISYEKINCLNIPYENHFDIIFLKSILPSIGTHDRKDLQEKAIMEIYKSLKKGGKLLFAENIRGSLLHNYTRKRFVKWGAGVRYIKQEELLNLLDKFSSVKYKEVGFLGAFGRTERQRKVLGVMDGFIDKFIPGRWKYLMVGVASK